jgi:hypothetical protein
LEVQSFESYESAIIMGADTVDSAYVTSDGEWIARSIIQGFFIAPIEALPEISVTDIVGLKCSHDYLIKRFTNKFVAVFHPRTRYIYGRLLALLAW